MKTITVLATIECRATCSCHRAALNAIFLQVLYLPSTKGFNMETCGMRGHTN
jgi:hypothetical protein